MEKPHFIKLEPQIELDSEEFPSPGPACLLQIKEEVEDHPWQGVQDSLKDEEHSSSGATRELPSCFPTTIKSEQESNTEEAVKSCEIGTSEESFEFLRTSTGSSSLSKNDLQGEITKRAYLSYFCTVCSRRFGRKNDFEIHNRIHTGEKPYSCGECSRTFSSKNTLRSHLKTHTGERPYVCNSCSRSFTEKTNLNAHRRTHTGEKPYACVVCSHSFTTKRNLTRHNRIHTGERPHACNICYRRFIHISNLKTHMKTHTTGKSCR